MPKVLWILMPMLCLAAPASAEIFKCRAKNGADLYQNFPCAIDTLGSGPSTSAPPNAPTVSAVNSSPAAPARAAPSAGPVNVASTPSPPSGSEPSVGMSADEVRALWGEPEEVVQDEPRKGGRVEIWQYADGRSVQLNQKQRVQSIQR